MSNLNFDSLVGNQVLDLDCPKCNAKVPYTINDVGNTIVCPGCSVEITLQATDSLSESKQSVDKALKDLQNTLKNFGK